MFQWTRTSKVVKLQHSPNVEEQSVELHSTESWYTSERGRAVSGTGA